MKHSMQAKARAMSSRPKVDTKMVTKEEAIKEPHNLGELGRITIRVFKRRGSKAIVTITERRATCPRIVGPRRNNREQCKNFQ